MKERKESDGRKNQSAIKIIDAYFGDDISDTLKDEIFEWMIVSENDTHIDNSLFEFFLERIGEDADGDTLSNYEEIIMRLDFLSSDKDVSRKKLREGYKPSIWVRTTRISAVVIPFFILIGYFFHSGQGLEVSDFESKREEAALCVEVGNDHQKRILLADSSEVWINSLSKINYSEDFTMERIVFLEGEAYFSVAHDPVRPMHIVAQSIVIEVLGTEFSVCTDSETGISEVFLVEGSVKIIKEGKTRHILKPGQRLHYNEVTSTFEVYAVEEKVEFSWKTDRLIFENMPLGHIIQKVAAYFGKDVEIDPLVRTDENFTFKFPVNFTLEDILDVQSDLSGNFTYMITDNLIRITPR